MARQEEAQRLGRVLRLKLIVVAPISTPWFPCVPVKKIHRHRQLFLAEQGYSYRNSLRSSNIML